MSLQEILRNVETLSSEEQQILLQQMLQKAEKNNAVEQATLSPLDLLKLPKAERLQYLSHSFALAAEEDFEVFEADDDADL